MEIKELEKLLKLCRKQGVTELNLGTVSFKLGDLPYKQEATTEQVVGFPDGELTPEQLMFYSAGGDPANDPFREDVEQ